MSTRKCFLCDDPITKSNDSKEHIILSSIGGRLTTRGCICIGCNAGAGQAWDAEHARLLNPLSLFFGIARDRGAPPSQVFETTAGELVMVNPGGSLSWPKPVYREELTPSGVRIHISARSPHEAEKMLRGVKRKYPNVETKGLLEAAAFTHSYPKGLVQFGLWVGGELSGRSMVKSAAAFAQSIGRLGRQLHFSQAISAGCG